MTQKQLKQALDYNPQTGIFTWKAGVSRKCPAGTIAGTPSFYGYIHICIAGKKHYAHRLAWLYIYGEFPKDAIDHVNRNKSDNRLGNLRPGNKSLNSANAKGRRDGLKGAFRNRRRWMGMITVNGKKKYLGNFLTEQEAHAAYAEAAKKHFGEYHCLS
jgi:HNH endonuclease